MKTVDHRLPRYQQLRDEIAHQIARKVWRPGDAIPTEAELAAEHDIAVGTVRRAIDMLVADGLVERQQGRGTFVRRPDFTQSLLRFLRYQGRDGRTVIPDSHIASIQVIPAPEEPAGHLGLPPGTDLLRIDRHRLLDGKVVMVEEIWLPKDRFAPLLSLKPEQFGRLMYPIYDEICGEIVAQAEEILTIEPLSAELATLLGQQEGAPAAVIERLALNYERQPLEWRISRAPGATFRYKIDLR